jgi:hypothetical protein
MRGSERHIDYGDAPSLKHARHRAANSPSRRHRERGERNAIVARHGSGGLNRRPQERAGRKPYDAARVDPLIDSRAGMPARRVIVVTTASHDCTLCCKNATFSKSLDGR